MSDAATMEPEPVPPPGAGNVLHGDLSTGEGGSVNIAGADQYNYTVSTLKRRNRFTSDAERLDRELRAVVSPPDLDAHLDTLREMRLLVLTGGRRTGLSTAARHRWKTFATASAGLRNEELFAADRDELLDDLGYLKRRTVLLLDASHDTALGGELPDLFGQLRAALHDQDCHLVVAMSEECRDLAERALPEAVHHLGRPDPFAVLERRTRRKDLLADLKAHHGFPDLIQTRWPPELATLAAMLDADGPGLGTDETIEQIEQLFDNWAGTLRPLLEKKLTDERPRALLLATGVLEGAQRSTIALASKELLLASGEEPATGSVLRDQSLSERFHPLEPDLERDGTRFRSRGLGEAILPYAWREYPSWRDPVRDWLDRLLRPSQLEDEALAVLLPRLLAAASSIGSAELVTGRAAAIAGSTGPGSRPRRELAAQLLLAGAIEPSIGQQVRHQLWTWSYHRSGVPVARLRTVALVCGDPDYARRFPRNALTRLKHLLKSEFDAVRESAVEGIVSVAREVPPQIVIERFTEWFTRDRDPRLHGALSETVAAVLLDDEARRRLLVEWLARDPSGSVRALWRSILAQATPVGAREAVAAWLALAAEARPEHRTALADHLTAAASSELWTLGQLAQAVSSSAWSSRSADDGVEVLRRRVQLSLSTPKATS